MKMKEKFKVTLTYVKVLNGSDTETKERTFTTDVEIDSDDPYTDVSDAAHEELYDKVGSCEVLREDIEDVERRDSK